MAKDMAQRFQHGNKLLVMGNGGSLCDALHFSVGMGGVWTFLVFLTGLLPLLFAITGLNIWWLKRRAR